MPPPRLLPPLRPCHPPWSGARVRWASGGGSNSRKQRGSDDSSSGTGSQDEGKKNPKEVHGWWGSTLSNVSALLSKEKVAQEAAQAASIPQHEETRQEPNRNIYRTPLMTDDVPLANRTPRPPPVDDTTATKRSEVVVEPKRREVFRGKRQILEPTETAQNGHQPASSVDFAPRDQTGQSSQNDIKITWTSTRTGNVLQPIRRAQQSTVDNRLPTHKTMSLGDINETQSSEQSESTQSKTKVTKHVTRKGMTLRSKDPLARQRMPYLNSTRNESHRTTDNTLDTAVDPSQENDPQSQAGTKALSLGPKKDIEARSRYNEEEQADKRPAQEHDGGDPDLRAQVQLLLKEVRRLKAAIGENTVTSVDTAGIAPVAPAKPVGFSEEQGKANARETPSNPTRTSEKTRQRSEKKSRTTEKDQGKTSNKPHSQVVINRLVQPDQIEHLGPISPGLTNAANDEGSPRHAQTSVMAASEKPTADAQRLVRNIHTRVKPPQPGPSPEELSEQSLLEELFPEVSSYVQPHYTKRNPYPKLDLPENAPVVHNTTTQPKKTQRERMVEAFQQRSERTTALQFLHCSTELTESDFRQLIPKGRHIESWIRDGEFEKVIPGRDPLSLERLPFYYLLFKSPESALAYQNNAARLHKLCGLHQPNNILSAVAPPRGFLEDGEDIAVATSSYLLKSPTLRLNLNMVLQPYNPALRAILDNGGYNPIVPNIDSNGEKIWKVLVHIEGWEPSQQDLYHIFVRHAYDRGLTWPLHKGDAAIHKLRDLIDIRSRFLPVSSASPRQANPDAHTDSDPSSGLSDMEDGIGDAASRTNISQIVTNRLYNRWIIDFSDEDAAKRFARMWNRRLLPLPKEVTWRDSEEVRMVNAEFLW